MKGALKWEWGVILIQDVVQQLNESGGGICSGSEESRQAVQGGAEALFKSGNVWLSRSLYTAIAVFEYLLSLQSESETQPGVLGDPGEAFHVRNIDEYI
jgi:hypothetical protein